MLTGKIHGAGERFEQTLHHMVRFAPVQQFQVQIAFRLIGEALEELPS